MYIMTANQDTVLNSDFVERFLLVKKNDAALVIASYNSERPPVTIGRYKDAEEAQGVLIDLYTALFGEQTAYTMPDSTLFFEEKIKKDARTKRKGGS